VRGALELIFHDGSRADSKGSYIYCFRGPEAPDRFSSFKLFGSVRECDPETWDEQYRDQRFLSIASRGGMSAFDNGQLYAPKAGMHYVAHIKDYEQTLLSFCPKKFKVEWLEFPPEGV
jgi:hypothetical protein